MSPLGLTITSSLGTPTAGLIGQLAEPVYSAAAGDKLILSESFDAYDGVFVGSNRLSSAYSAYRVLNLNNANQQTDDSLAMLVTGRGGTGKALRILYGNPTPGAGAFTTGASDCILGPQGQWTSKGAPFVHFLVTMWFRYSAGADPSAGTGGNGDSGVKGFMFWHDGNQRYEHPPHRLKDYTGGRYTDTRFDVGPPHPPNATTGLNHWRTGTGEPPPLANYTDGNWHRLTVELYPRDNQVTPHLYAGHQGERVWLDGILIFDNVDNLGFNGDTTSISGCPPWGGDYCYTAGVTGMQVFGNYVNATTAYNSPAFTIDHDDWVAWTN